MGFLDANRSLNLDQKARLNVDKLVEKNLSSSENKGKRKERQILGPCQITKKAVEHQGDGDTIRRRCTWNVPKGSKRDLEELEMGERIENIETIALLISARILRRIQET